METASHLSFIKPFIAFIAEGALFYELLNNPAAHMYILQSYSSQLSLTPGRDYTNDLHRALCSLSCG